MKRFFKHQNVSRWIGFLFSFLIFGIIIYASMATVSRLKEEEQKRMITFAKATQILANEEGLTEATQVFLTNVILDNTSIPTILAEEDGVITDTRNIPENIAQDSIQLKQYFYAIKNDNPPILIALDWGNQFVYYSESSLLKSLRYYPVVLILIIILFVLFTYWYFRVLKNTEQSFLWAGMAKETAHQIGTPLSSLMGWVEVLRMENTDEDMMTEIEKDLHRLNQITERFSKIGSHPQLKPADIVQLVENNYNYFKERVPQKLNFSLNIPNEKIILPLNTTLMDWVLENLIKNAIDAMGGEGNLSIDLENKPNEVQILVMDSGKGIPKATQKKIFQPGFTTKKRGWGLGLSLAKRIVEYYHHGKIYVAQSSKETGTIIAIQLKKG